MILILVSILALIVQSTLGQLDVSSPSLLQNTYLAPYVHTYGKQPPWNITTKMTEAKELG